MAGDGRKEVQGMVKSSKMRPVCWGGILIPRSQVGIVGLWIQVVSLEFFCISEMEGFLNS